MANVLAPQGFQEISVITGSGPNYAQNYTRRIAQGNTTAIFRGDPVVQLTSGYITQATAGTTQIAGIFMGCEYVSVSQGRTVRSNFWPGTSDAAADIAAFIIDWPDAVFRVQANAGPVTISSVGQNANFAIGTGNTLNGFSGATLNVSTIATTTTLPFRVLNFAGNTGYVVGDGAPAIVGNGSDGTTAYNFVYVRFNNQDSNSLTGI